MTLPTRKRINAEMFIERAAALHGQKNFTWFRAKTTHFVKNIQKNYTIDENVIQYTNDNVPICGTQYW